MTTLDYNIDITLNLFVLFSRPNGASTSFILLYYALYCQLYCPLEIYLFQTSEVFY